MSPANEPRTRSAHVQREGAGPGVAAPVDSIAPDGHAKTGQMNHFAKAIAGHEVQSSPCPFLSSLSCLNG